MPLYKVLPHTMPVTLLDCGWPLPTPDGPGDWMPAVVGELVLFENGYDLCRPQDLVRCLGPTMFEAEFQGDSLECEHRLLVRQARLTRSAVRRRLRRAGRAAPRIAGGAGELAPGCPRHDAPLHLW
jgi:hypothetical protein